MSSRRGVVLALFVALVAAPTLIRAEEPGVAADPNFSRVLERFLSLDDATSTAYRALRRLEVRNEQQTVTAWMDVWTESDGSGRFTYDIVAQGGSSLVRSKVFLASLEAEKKMSEPGAPGRAAFTRDNYTFEPAQRTAGLSELAVTSKRADVMLINGSIFLHPDTGELVRLEGRLSKTPSFWIKQVDVVRCYERVGGVRVPVSLDAVAKVRMGGRNTFHMSYQYEKINGRRVGAPEVRLAQIEQ
jgi:hypothetical protein